MKYLIISDIHANIKAFQAVLKKALNYNFSHVLCLGDITGYGAEPNECILLVQELIKKYANTHVLLGNHDAVLIEKIPLEWFRTGIHRSINYTKKIISPENLEWLASLKPSQQINSFTWAFHGSPQKPITEYLWGGFETDNSMLWLKEHKARLCFVGHTHEAVMFLGFPNKRIQPVLEKKYSLAQVLACVNPGSVGFPRTLIHTQNTLNMLPITEKSYPAYFAIWDSKDNSISWHEARYNHSKVRKHYIAFGI